MPSVRSKVKITVVKKLSKNDIFGDAPPLRSTSPPVCTRLQEGQEFIVDGPDFPTGFCAWAFADIQRDISHLRLGGDYPWMEKKGTMLACCTDGNRPVIFKLERIED
jgi:uncharacterized repeat protein (TIGR04076 family)